MGAGIGVMGSSGIQRVILSQYVVPRNTTNTAGTITKCVYSGEEDRDAPSAEGSSRGTTNETVTSRALFILPPGLPNLDTRLMQANNEQGMCMELLKDVASSLISCRSDQGRFAPSKYSLALTLPNQTQAQSGGALQL